MGDLDTIQQFFFVFMHCKSLSLLLGGGVWIQSNDWFRVTQELMGKEVGG